MFIEVRDKPYDPWREIADYQASGRGPKPGSYGACSAFVGTMRDFNQDENVEAMVLQHYPGMTEKLLTEYAEQVVTDFRLLDLMILHRVGPVYPNDPIVLVAAWSAHRAAAFDGARDMMEYLKSKATFWKKETLEREVDGSRERWVDNVS